MGHVLRWEVKESGAWCQATREVENACARARVNVHLYMYV